MLIIDLNCDLGESFGRYSLGQDEEVIRYISSGNVACGFHAGDPGVMRRTVELLAARNVAIGAHPGLPDLVGFGRRELAVEPEEVENLVIYQVGALKAFAESVGAGLCHVKPHGALYNMAAKRADLANAIARGVAAVDRGLILVGMAGSELVEAGGRAGLRVAREGFVDRSYEPDGTLSSRKKQGAVFTDVRQAVDQALRMVLDGKVATGDGLVLDLAVDTLCLHGDGETALEFAAAVRKGLEDAGVRILPLSHR